MKHIATPWRDYVPTIDNEDDRIVISDFFEAGETLIKFLSYGHGLTCKQPKLYTSREISLNAKATPDYILIPRGVIDYFQQRESMLVDDIENITNRPLVYGRLNKAKIMFMWTLAHEFFHVSRNHFYHAEANPDTVEILEFDADCMATAAIYRFLRIAWLDFELNPVETKQLVLYSLFWPIRHLVGSSISKPIGSSDHPSFHFRLLYTAWKLAEVDNFDMGEKLNVEKFKPEAEILTKTLGDCELAYIKQLEVNPKESVLFQFLKKFAASRGDIIDPLSKGYNEIRTKIQEHGFLSGAPFSLDQLQKIVNTHQMSPPPTTETPMCLPVEFRTAIPIQRFHRFAVVERGEHAYFGLLGEDGINNYFQCSRGVIASLAMEFHSMADHMETVSREIPKNTQFLPFSTTSLAVEQMFGGEVNGHVVLNFFTTSGDALTTTLRPGLAVMLEQSLKGALDSLPHRPKVQNSFTTYTPGSEPTSGKTSEYFGQMYPSQLLESLGVITVRASLLDRSLVQLFIQMSGLPPLQAEEDFFSIRSTAARVDMMIELLPTVALREDAIININKALNKASLVIKKRNELLDGEWKFKDDEMVVEPFSLAANKSENGNNAITITSEYLDSLAAEYGAVTHMVSAACLNK